MNDNMLTGFFFGWELENKINERDGIYYKRCVCVCY